MSYNPVWFSGTKDQYTIHNNCVYSTGVNYEEAEDFVSPCVFVRKAVYLCSRREILNLLQISLFSSHYLHIVLNEGRVVHCYHFERCLFLVRLDSLSFLNYYDTLRNLGIKDYWSQNAYV